MYWSGATRRRLAVSSEAHPQRGITAKVVSKIGRARRRRINRSYLECAIHCASCCRRHRIFDFDPGLRRTRFINGRKPLRHDALKPEIADGGKKFVTMALSVFNILDALSRFAEHPF